MTYKVEPQRDYTAQIQSQAVGYKWQVTSPEGRTARGHAQSPYSARQCCDFTIGAMEALHRLAKRRF